MEAPAVVFNTGRPQEQARLVGRGEFRFSCTTLLGIECRKPLGTLLLLPVVPKVLSDPPPVVTISGLTSQPHAQVWHGVLQSPHTATANRLISVWLSQAQVPDFCTPLESDHGSSKQASHLAGTGVHTLRTLSPLELAHTPR